MKSFRRFAGAAAVTALFAGAVAAQDSKITLGYVASGAFVSAFVAEDQGFFEKNGLSVELQRVNVGSTLPAALVAGSVQVATLTPPPVLLANEGGLGLGIVAAASYETAENFIAGAIARPQAGIKDAAGFVGKRVAIPGLNSAGHLRFVDWLRNNQVDDRTVTFVEVPLPQMAELLTAGTVDAAIITEPFLTRAEQAGVGEFVADYAAATTEPVMVGIYVASAGWAADNPALVQQFRAAVTEAADWINANPEAARKIQSTYLNVPAEVAAAMRVPAASAAIRVENVAYWVEMMRRFEVLREDADPASFIVE